MNTKFKVIAMGRVGTVAINRYINSHPQLSLPSFNQTTKAFISPTANITDLLTDSSQKSAKQGLIIHDALFFDKKYRKKLTAMNDIKVTAILHMVRNPYDLVKSWINHINASASMGVLGWSEIPPSAESFYKNYPEHFDTMRYGLQCRSLYKNYKHLKVVDFPALMSQKIEQTMAAVYDFLGVDNHYRSPLLHETQNTYTNEMLIKGIDFKLNNEIIEMCMLPVDTFFHKDENAKAWITIHDTHKIYDLCPSLPKATGDLVLMPKSHKSYNNLSSKTRKMLGEGITDIVREVLAVWAKRAEATAQQIEADKLKSLSEADRDFVTKMMKDDLDIFFRYHSEFKTLWDI
jgi:hypothetical protein